MAGKRRADANGDHHDEETALVAQDGGQQLAKRSRVSQIVAVSERVVAPKRVGARTSGLSAPTLLLSGHGASVLSLKFSPCGQHAASSSFDKSICACCGVVICW